MANYHTCKLSNYPTECSACENRRLEAERNEARETIERMKLERLRAERERDAALRERDEARTVAERLRDLFPEFDPGHVRIMGLFPEGLPWEAPQ